MKRSIMIGKKVEVTFWDHCITENKGDTDPVQCRAIGQVVKDTDRELVLAFWLVDNCSREMLEENWKTATILKKAIIYFEVLQ